ncbi:MAG: hypothetical protein VB143_05050 [Burkholderia sp.]
MDGDTYVEAADLAGVTLSSYAREHGLAVQALYLARRRMRDEQARKRAEPSPEPASPFVEVKVGPASVAPAPAATTTPRARVWAQLPNGVSVELRCTSADVERLVAMMDALGRTACSASTRI